MKFNGNYLKEFWWTDFYKWIKTGKKKKSLKVSKKTRLEWINPVFTYHSLIRLSERVCNKYIKYCTIKAWKYLIKWEFEAWWIPPKLIKSCIHDIKHSMQKDLLYNESRDAFAIRWKICIYIISRTHEIITIYKEFEKEQKKEYRAVANRDAIIFFNL